MPDRLTIKAENFFFFFFETSCDANRFSFWVLVCMFPYVIFSFAKKKQLWTAVDNTTTITVSKCHSRIHWCTHITNRCMAPISPFTPPKKLLTAFGQSSFTTNIEQNRSIWISISIIGQAGFPFSYVRCIIGKNWKGEENNKKRKENIEMWGKKHVFFVIRVFFCVN